MTKLFTLFLILILISMQNSWSACSILTSSGKTAPSQADAINVLLSAEPICPTDVFVFRQLLKKSDLKLATTMVANQGFHDPHEGSFSLFEMVTGQLKITGEELKPGDFFFGHFTAVDDHHDLILDQDPEKNSLMIEALAWDAQKGMFNFYELRGDGQKGQWFYRGDSGDIFADNQLLHRQPDAQHPQFGKRLRCSGCHDAGGPIMKELESPHNDWWMPERKLDFGGRTLSNDLKEVVATLVSADELRNAVKQGSEKLAANEKFSHQLSTHSLQEQLRPLFCPMEINFRSDTIANDEQRNEISIPLEFFIDPRLLNANDIKNIAITRAHYAAALHKMGSHFPGTKLPDADHAWLTPVKANSDQIAVHQLIEKGIIDKKFMFDVLSIDMTNPALSQARCHLLRLLPEDVKNWEAKFMNKLAHSPDPAAKQLLQNMANPAHTPEYYQQQAKIFLNNCRTKLTEPVHVEKLLQLLNQRRREIKTSEISANPLGQILEPGFRVIFPEVTMPGSGQLKLTVECNIVE